MAGSLRLLGRCLPSWAGLAKASAVCCPGPAPQAGGADSTVGPMQGSRGEGPTGSNQPFLPF